MKLVSSFRGELDLEPQARNMGELAGGFPNAAERQVANVQRDEIAQNMWIQYQVHHHQID
jgi:hypothetical protein